MTSPVWSSPTPAPASATPAPPRSVGAKLAAALGDIKLAHSVFAMPFAVLAAFMAAASVGRLPSLTQILLIIACMFFARTAAMLINRWADAAYDARNPRTRARAAPSGRVSRPFLLGLAGISALSFVIAAGGFWLSDANPWPLLLSPLVLAWLALYSFGKRFTSLCHLLLGSALAISPVAAAIAVEPVFLQQPEVWLLAAMVMCWVAGFDVIYALADVAVDCELGVFSLPARLGVEPALWISRALHALALAALAAAWWTSDALNLWFALGLGLTAALLLLEHALVWRSEKRHLDAAFFTVNGVISILLGLLGLIDAIHATTG